MVLWLTPEVVRSSLVLFHRDGGGDVVVEEGRNRSPGGEVEADGLANLLRQDVDQGVVCPSGGKGVGDILKRNC